MPDDWLTGSQELLEKAEAAGVEVMVVEYIPPASATGAQAELQAEIAYLEELGVPLYVADERDLVDIYTFYSIEDDGNQPEEGITQVGTSAGEIMIGTGGDDFLDGARGNDTLDGGNGNDLLLGGRGGDTLLGGAGGDVLNGGAGPDTLNGGADDDTLNAGRGHDTLNGGEGDDKLTGGLGYDTFVFKDDWGWDLVTDFNPDQDKLLISADDSAEMYQSGANTIIEFASGDAIELVNLSAELLEGFDLMV